MGKGLLMQLLNTHHLIQIQQVLDIRWQGFLKPVSIRLKVVRCYHFPIRNVKHRLHIDLE